RVVGRRVRRRGGRRGDTGAAVGRGEGGGVQEDLGRLAGQAGERGRQVGRRVVQDDGTPAGAEQRGGGEAVVERGGVGHSDTRLSPSATPPGTRPAGVQSPPTVTGRPPETASSRHGSPATGATGSASPPAPASRHGSPGTGTTSATITGHDVSH